MKSKRSPWILLLWPASLLLTLGVVWTTGYMYWQIRISRAIAELKHEPAKYRRDPHYSDPDLVQIGSRGFPRMAQELGDALAHRDSDPAFALTCGLATLFNSANQGINDIRPLTPTIELMEAILEEYRRQWEERRGQIAPSWMWWRGTFRSG